MRLLFELTVACCPRTKLRGLWPMRRWCVCGVR